MRRLIICTPHQRLSDQIQENEVGRAGSMYGGESKVYTGFWWGNLRKRDHLENPAVDGGKILNGSSGSGMEDTDWISVAQDSDRSQALVNVVMNLRVP